MSATLLVNELNSLISDSKRKNADLRNAAEKSLQELKSLPATSEQQLAADLSRRPTFIDPFLIACGTKTTKFAGSGVTCLQKLVISKGLPKTRLKDALDGFNACTELGLDLQLKVLQALPSLLQNYADELQDELLASALQVCASLQSAKVQTVSGVAAATLQQLVMAVFEKVADEDRRASSIPTTAEVPGDGEPISLRPAAFDAYRMFRDLVLVAEERQTKFVRLTSLSPEASLELISSCLQGNLKLFVSHTELSSVVRSNLLPLVTRALSEKLSFPMTVRCMRILDLVLRRQFSRFSDQCEVAIGLLTQDLDVDMASAWRRALAMEVVRNFFASGHLVIEAYAAFDQSDGGKPIIQDLLSAFVRLSAEKPTVIGLGQQSSVPIGPQTQRDLGSEQATLEAAGGMAGVISSALGVTEVSVPGVSSQWSLPRAACLDQLDKVEAPPLPETYIYTLVLECLNSLSDSLAKVVLPLTVQHDEAPADSPSETHADHLAQHPTSRTSRSPSFSKRTVPLNPLELEDSPSLLRARAVAGLIDNCWPAVLATSSTFLNAALEDHYYRNLIKAFQRFAQVAGLLRLATPRDALMTTLSKSAVPPHVLSAAMNEGAKSPMTESQSPRVFSNPKSLLSVESLVSPTSPLSNDRDKRSSLEPIKAILTTRNLLCLRALLNLAIALGPTLDNAFSVVVDALRQTDLILSSAPHQQALRQASVPSTKGVETATAAKDSSAEVAAVEAAASRLLESTVDYPNEAFVAVLRAFLRLLSGIPSGGPSSKSGEAAPLGTPRTPRRTFSGLPGISTFAQMQLRDYQFVIPKLGNLAQLNVSRFIVNDPSESGWFYLVDELASVASTASKPREARQAATDVLCKLAAESILEVAEDDEEARALVQRRSLTMLLQLIDAIYAEDGELTNTDLDVQAHVLEALKAILDRCGDSLIAGWNKTIAILSSAFERTESASTAQKHDVGTQIDWDHISNDLVSVPVGRIAFAAAELICSDFLAMLPTTVVPSLIELLYRFIGQNDDLNIALTTVTMAWNVSDYLFENSSARDIEELVVKVRDAHDLTEEAQHEACGGKPGQLLLLLLRMREAVHGTQKEVRKATFQTICSIFKNQGEQLTPDAWDLLLRNIVGRIASNDAMARFANSEDEQGHGPNAGNTDEEISKIIITGTSDIIAQHLRVIEQSKKLPSLWEVILSAMELYLDWDSHLLNAAVFGALAQVLMQVASGSSTWTTPAYRTVALWLRRVPEHGETSTGGDGNQDAYLAYIDTASQLYRLTKQSMSSPQTRKLVDNIYFCVRHSDGPKYGGDVSNMSPLQTRALDLLKTIRTDLPNLPSRLIGAAAQLTTLHHDTAETNKTGPTFVAVSSEAIAWLRLLILSHADDPEIIESGALIAGIQSLRRLVTEKYTFPTEHKGLPVWRRATTTAQELSGTVIEISNDVRTDNFVRAALWAEYVSIAAGIVQAKGIESIESREKVYDDMLFDIESFRELQAVLIPRLGSPELPDEIRFAYCRSVFEASVVHMVEPGEIPPPSVLPLRGLHVIRRARVKYVPFCQREQMCYICFSELIALASRNGDTAEQKKLAQAAAPLLILRLAIPIRAYIADQPLRGCEPQPLSELEELLFCFEQIGKLQLQPDALASEFVAGGPQSERAHLHYIYPLLAKAVATAGDRWSGATEVLYPLQSLLATIMPVP